VVAVDDDECPGVRHGGDERLDVPAGCAACEEDLRHEHEIVPALSGSLLKARRKGRGWLGWHAHAKRHAVFLKPLHLPAKRVKLGVRR
jgi:uncharacterized protein YcaQ